MGTSIHYHLERAPGQPGEPWEHLELPGDHPFHTLEWRLAFALLAGKRNRERFDPIEPEPRGLPEDASPETRAAAARLGSDGHSHSWVWIQEIVDWPMWEQPCLCFASWLEEADFAAFERGTLPRSALQGFAGHEFAARQGEATTSPEGAAYRLAVWREAPIERLRDLRDGALALAAHGPLDQLRVVYWFDN